MVAVLGLLVGLAMVASGVLGVRHAYAHKDRGGDRRHRQRAQRGVEPADWNVFFTKVFAGCVAAAGAFVVLLAVLD